MENIYLYTSLDILQLSDISCNCVISSQSNWQVYVFQSLASGKKILILATIIIIKNLSVLMVKNRISLKKKKTLCPTL